MSNVFTMKDLEKLAQQSVEEPKSQLVLKFDILAEAAKRRDNKGAAEEAVKQAQTNISKMSSAEIFNLTIALYRNGILVGAAKIKAREENMDSNIQNKKVAAKRIADDHTQREAVHKALAGIQAKFKNWSTLARTKTLATISTDLFEKLGDPKVDHSQLGSLLYAKIQFVACNFSAGLKRITDMNNTVKKVIQMIIVNKYLRLGKNEAGQYFFTEKDQIKPTEEDPLVKILKRNHLMDPRFMGVNSAYRQAPTDEKEKLQEAIFASCDELILDSGDFEQDMTSNTEYDAAVITGINVLKRFQKSALRILAPNATGPRTRDSFRGATKSIRRADWLEEDMIPIAPSVARRVNSAIAASAAEAPSE